MDIKQAKILIVEDEEQINRLIELVLISDGYYKIRKAYSGSEALKLIKTDKPDLILLDIMIPDIDGYTLCKQIKEDSYLKSVQVIMLTAKNLEENILQGFETGAIDYIPKPFSNKILLARIKAHLCNMDINTKTSYNNIQIDDMKKTVTVDNKNINLTKFEYEILKTFLSSPGTVFTRSQLLNCLRGDDAFNISERAIDVQILNLRRKLEEFGSNILTIRGVGYKLKELNDEKER